MLERRCCNIPFRQAIAVVLVLAVAGYLAFLLYSQYKVQAELNRVALDRFVAENDKRAITAENFLADRMHDMAQLAENRDISLYYENKALGMTMEYGLGASIEVARESFVSFRKRKRLKDQEVFRRIVYLDAAGSPLIDLNDDSGSKAVAVKWRSYLKNDRNKPRFMLEKSDGVDCILITHPVQFKGEYAGQLLGWLPVSILYDNYIAPSSARGQFLAALSLDNSYILLPPDITSIVPRERIPAPLVVKSGSPYKIEFSEEDNRAAVIVTYAPLHQTPFAIVTFYKGQDGMVARNSQRLVVAMSVVGMLLLGGSFVFLRTSVKYATLQAHLEESEIREKIISEKNESLRKLTAAVEQSASTIVITDTEGVIEYVNPFFSRVTGYSFEEAIGQNPRILKADDADPSVFIGLWSTITTGKTWSGELHNKAKDGRLYWEQATIAPVKDDAGITRHYIAVKEDITDRKAAELELRQAKEAAEAASQAKSAFLANMSHEIRTPMNGVMGMTDLCLDTDLTREQRTYLEAVKSSADNLLSIINDILDFSKIEAGRIELFPEPFRLRNTVGHALRSVAVRAVEKGLEIVFEPHLDTPDSLLGDPLRLRQILLNLVGNAVKFTEKGQIVVSVRKIESGDDGSVLLSFSVADQGIGITPAQKQRIFAAFEQADISTTKSYGGTGLGLTITKRLVELMGGDISVESTPGTGSVFTFTACFKAIDLPEYHLDELRGKRVLVVDDVAVNRSMLQGFLRQWGMDVETAESSGCAVAILEESRSHFDLALLDGQMPEEDGWHLAAKIRGMRAFASMPLVIMPSVGLRGDASRCKELDINGYLVKPVIHEELYELLRAVLGLSGNRGSSEPVTANTIPDVHSRLKILATDDVPVNQEVIRAILEKRGHIVSIASNGIEAVSAWRSGRYDLLLMDVQMPEMDGLEATARIRSEEAGHGLPRVPIIAMTAYAMTGDRERCLDAGMDDYVTKPINPAELNSVIARATGNIELREEPPEQPPVATVCSVDADELVFDAKTFIMRIGGNESLVPSFLKLFEESATKHIASLHQALESADYETARRNAHTIKGSAANVGALQLRAAAFAFEKCDMQSDNGCRDRMLEAIEAAYQRFLDETTCYHKQ